MLGNNTPLYLLPILLECDYFILFYSLKKSIKSHKERGMACRQLEHKLGQANFCTIWWYFTSFSQIMKPCLLTTFKRNKRRFKWTLNSPNTRMFGPGTWGWMMKNLCHSCMKYNCETLNHSVLLIRNIFFYDRATIQVSPLPHLLHNYSAAAPTRRGINESCSTRRTSNVTTVYLTIRLSHIILLAALTRGQ